MGQWSPPRLEIEMFVILKNGQVVPCTRCETLQEAITALRTFEQVYRDFEGDPRAASPYTIGRL